MLCLADGNFLAFGSRDNSIYVYKVEDGAFTLLGECARHG